MHDKKIVYKNKFFRIFEGEVKLPDGKFHKLYGMDRSDGVAIIPIKNNKLVILKHFRSAIENWDYELPMGYINKGESKRAAAVRELKEETGYDAKEIRYLFSSYSTAGYSKQQAHFFLAVCGKHANNKNPDKSEFTKTEFVTLNESLKMIKEHKIRGAVTIQALLYYARYLK